MSSGNVSLTETTVKGDVAGGDIVDKSQHFHYSGSKAAYMKSLLAKFKEEEKGNTQIQSFIEDLDYFYNKRKDDVIGLEEKLTAGDRKELVEFAVEFKDRFHKLLFKYQFSEAAQKILLHLLAEVQSRFINEVYPSICDKAEAQVVNTLVTERIIEPIKDQLEENYLDITPQHINGMVYFLTGNCHLKWVK